MILSEQGLLGSSVISQAVGYQPMTPPRSGLGLAIGRGSEVRHRRHQRGLQYVIDDCI